MSVINKMLRDLDARRAGAPESHGAASLGNTAGPPGARYGMLAGSAVAAAGAAQQASGGRTARSSRWIGVVVVLATLAAAAGWLLHTPVRLAGVAPSPALPAVVFPTASAVAAATPVAVALGKPTAMTPAAAQTTPPHLSAAPGTTPSRLVDRPTLPDAKPSAAPSAGQVAGVAGSVAQSTQPLSGQLSLTPTSESPPVPASGADAPGYAPVTAAAQPQRAVSAPVVADAMLVLVARAQAFWREGDRNSALKLLQGAIQQLGSQPTSDAQRNAAVVALVREYARCSLISGQAADVLATLDRLQPQLAGVADVWAIRGNAAQRLGQHTHAVAAYQQALALSPNEARWMLGAAVSLAALGQTEPAAEWAEKVRSARAMPPDVANYLRQLGVVVRSD